MKYISLFAGIGGFDLALNRLGHECVYANDFDKYCKIIYDKNFENKLDTTTLPDVDASSVPDHDLLVGGFPCQSFSIAGKRGGFDDTRGTLFFDIARIIKEKRTKYLILENVKGLLSHDQGRTFKTILSTLTELGYDIQTMVLNSKNFGVPQNRERVFIVGHLRGEPRPKVFPITGGDTKDNESGQVATTINSGGGGQGAKTGLYAIRQPLKFLKRNQRNIEGDYSFTIDSANTGGVKVGMKIRRLTPKECLRLQGFPDSWFDDTGVSDTQKYKMCGNAVTVNVVEAIAKYL